MRAPRRSQGGHRLADRREPPARDAVVIAIEEPRHDVVLELVVERLGVDARPGARGPRRSPRCRWTNRSVARPAPASCQTSSHQPSRVLRFSAPLTPGLHAADAACLEGPPRGVEPQVDALCEDSVGRQVEVLDEDKSMAEATLLGEVRDGLEELLAVLVPRVGLAGEHDLHGSLRVRQQSLEPVRVAEEQRRALVGDEAPDEADRERVGVEQSAELGDRRAVGAPPHQRAPTLSNGVHEPRPRHVAASPQLVVIGIEHRRP